MTVTVNIDKARVIAHAQRREARDAEFAPLDVQATIPSMAAEAEAKRQAIRDKHADIQADIDAAESVDVLKQIMGAL